MMPVGFAGEAAHIQEIGHLSVADVARATGSDDSTVRAWLNESRSPTGERAERLAELSSIVERMANVMEGAYIPVWLRKPNQLLEDDKPLDVIARGEYRLISRLLASLEGSPTT